MRVLPYLAFSMLASLATAQQPLIPFQGHLTVPSETDTNVYEPVPAGQYDVLFTLYTAPAGGESKVWGPERHENVTVVNGLVNAIIGSVEELPEDDPQFFARPLYVGITIDADGNPATPDLELVPRQVWLPEVYAYQSGDANLLDGHDWSAILDGGATDPTATDVQFRRSLMNLPPNTNILSSLELADGISEPDAVGKVVEVIPQSNKLQLAVDVPGSENGRIRGIYLENGDVQISGVATYNQGGLTPGLPCWLAVDESLAGTIIQARPTDETRSEAVQVGFALSENTIELIPMSVDLFEINIPTGNQLMNPDFALGNPNENPPPFWGDAFPGVNPNGVSNEASCTLSGGGTNGHNSQSNALTQLVMFPENMYHLIDSNRMRVKVGGVVDFNINQRGFIGIRFEDDFGNLNGEIITYNYNPSGCLSVDEVVCIPENSRSVRVLLWDNSQTINFDTMYLNYQLVDSGDCP